MKETEREREREREKKKKKRERKRERERERGTEGQTEAHFSGKSKWGLSKFRYLSTIVHDFLQGNCRHFATKVPFLQRGPKGHKCAQWQMTVHKMQRVGFSI